MWKMFQFLPSAYVVRREGTVFTGVCLSTPDGGTLTPSHNTSTGPRSLLGGTQPGPDRGVPSPDPDGGGTLARDGVPPIQRCSNPIQGWCTPPSSEGYSPAQRWVPPLG